ncbi:MAG TPA: hypothetical protein PK504_05430 [Ferruginibacter sp.]|nr:hypothetical protein [Ferruginibacter sp.]HRE63181.1 hypothetical protein [Ferruginibacter sp.]
MKIFIPFFIFFIIASYPVIAQNNNKKTPTLKESVDELKESTKAIGNLFKKKDKKVAEKQTTADSVIKTSAIPLETEGSSTVTVNVADTILPVTVKELIIAECIKNYKADKPKLTKAEDATYMNLEFDFGQGVRNSAYFSKLKKENIFGDLNNDGKEDAVVKVYTNTGGNSDYLDLYIFLQLENSWKLVLVKASSDDDIKGCTIGQFVPTHVQSGLLIGESSCFLESDPRCCPSLYYKTTLKLSNNKLVFIKKEKIVKKN